MSRISVIMACFNQQQYIAESIESVLRQSFQDWELIIVDDGSTDNSPKILQQYAKKDSRIKVINQKNLGVVVARNNGIAQATADLIYPLDADDIISPSALQELYNAFVNHRGDVITSRVTMFGNKTGEMVFPNPTKLNFCRQNCSVNAALFRKSDFIAAGGYDSAYTTALEDYDLWLNFVYRQNLKFYRVPKILFFYRMKDKAESRNEQHRNLHNDIVKTFYTKYPKMRYWFIISKYLKKLKRIARFFFRIQDNTIKIFKIPVWHIGAHKRVRIFGIFVPIPWAKNLSAYWFREQPNFGDLLNSYLFDYFGYPVTHESVSRCNLIAIGSLMELLFSEKKCRRKRFPLIVYGTGFIKAPGENKFLTRNLDVRVVRGYNTLARLQGLPGVKIADNVVVADPGLLSVLLLDGKMPKKKYKLGIIPHYVDQCNPLLKNIKCKNTTFIDITLDPVSFMNKIAECENVISSAMHGLIAADALGIPNIRMMLSDKIYGGDYKFDDYYSAFDIKKHNRVDLRKKSFTEKDLDNLKNIYQVKPKLVRQKQIELLNAFPYKIKRKVCL